MRAEADTSALLSCLALFFLRDKRKKVSIDLILECSRKAVGRTRIVDFLRALDQLGRFSGRVLHWHDLIIFAVHDKRWHIELSSFPNLPWAMRAKRTHPQSIHLEKQFHRPHPRCPLWVKSRHSAVSEQCPLYPRKQTLATAFCERVAQRRAERSHR